MPSAIQSETRLHGSNLPLANSLAHRARPASVLFIHRDAEVVNNCVEELKRARFVVSADVVLTLAQCKEQLRANSYDVIVVEYPSPNCKGPKALELLRQTAQEIPLLFLTTGLTKQALAGLTPPDAFEYVESEHIAQLPMEVRRALNEKELRAELEEAGKALRHSQSLYRALVDNPAYGVCQCDAQGKFIDVNQALLTMLGYENKEELLSANRTSDIVLDLGQGRLLDGTVAASMQTEPVEAEWKRKNGTILKVRLSGRDVFDEYRNFSGWEVIVVDITEQRSMEDHLRRQASSDSLTGLANHGRLFEVLHAEIGRTKRTGREFSLILLDLDGLKEINDRCGHLVGNEALCRLAHSLTDCCRSVDTAARQGGDEFALVLPETGTAAATMVGQRICELLARDTEGPALSVSLGVATYPQDADTIGTLICAADRALYAMKTNGKNGMGTTSYLLAAE